jgi:hypothetical protein
MLVFRRIKRMEHIVKCACSRFMRLLVRRMFARACKDEIVVSIAQEQMAPLDLAVRLFEDGTDGIVACAYQVDGAQRARVVQMCKRT